MLLFTWLRTLFSGPRSASAQSTPDAAQTEPVPLPLKSQIQPDPIQPDNGVRMHIAAHDPAFPAKREAAFDTITAAIDTVAQAHGFITKPKSWAKSGELGTVTIHLLRSRYGFDCHINMGFQPLDDAADGPAAQGPWAQDDFVSLVRFYPPQTPTLPNADADEVGIIAYLDVYLDAGSLDQPMTVLSEQALPWLLAHLTDPDAPNRPFLPDPQSPDPQTPDPQTP